MAAPDELILELSPYYKQRKNLKDKKVINSAASQEFFISYNSSMESLEPVYFWILDFMEGLVNGKAEKLVDTFQSSVGSGHFSELMGKATRMQEEGMKIMQTIGILIKSVINIIYDLKQFEIRLHDYEAANSDDEQKKEAGILALKQIWLDNVDMKKGNSSIKAMTFSQQGSFLTLLNAFLSAKSLKDVDKIDLNDIVKRVLKQRILEFEEWKKLSEEELTKRYDIQRTWLKSQVDSLELYSRWAAPYFEAAEALRMNTDKSASLINAFNSILLKLTIFQRSEIKVEQEVISKSLPQGFDSLGKKIRKTFACLMIDFGFRGIPQKVEQHYGFGGKSDVSFKAFALNEDELALFEKKLAEDDRKKALKLAESVTGASLERIKEDIEHFTKDIGERKSEKKEEEEKNEEDVNPFTALLSIKLPKKEKSEEKDKKLEELEKKGVTPDNYYEKIVRSLAESKAQKTLFTIYDVYKKAHGMASVPFSDYSTDFQIKDVAVGFTDIFKK